MGLVVLIICFGAWAASTTRRIHDDFEVARLIEKTKTVCVGRQLVDVPVRAKISFSGAVLDGFDVDSLEESVEQFRERLAARETEIASRAPATDGTGGMVEAHDLRIPRMTGRTLIYGRNRAYWFENGRRFDDESSRDFVSGGRCLSNRCQFIRLSTR